MMFRGRQTSESIGIEPGPDFVPPTMALDSIEPEPDEPTFARCVHCRAEVALTPVPRSDPPQQAWSDGHPRYPFYCPKALNMTHAVLDVKA